MNDVSKKTLFYEIERVKHEKNLASVFVANQNTNGILNFRANISFELPENLNIYFPLYTKALTWMGTRKRSRDIYSQEAQMFTGGISFSPYVRNSLFDVNLFTSGMTVTSHCLHRNLDKMLDLVLDPILNLNCTDTENFHNLLKMISSASMSSLASSGHTFASIHSASFFGKGFQLIELYEGLTQMEFIDNLAKAETNKVAKALDAIKAIHQHLRKGMSIEILSVSEEDGLSKFESPLETFTNSLPIRKSEQQFKNGIIKQLHSQGNYFVTPLSIHHVGQSILTVPYDHPDSPSLSILAKLLTNGYLHREIREKNGAYGGGSRFNSSTGVFTFFSYRDPSFANTLNAFRDSAQWLLQNQFSDREITEAKLAVFSALDQPIEPGFRGAEAFDFGMTYELKQRRRDRLFGVTRNSLLEAAHKYIQTSDKEDKRQTIVVPVTTVIGPNESTQALPKVGWVIKK